MLCTLITVFPYNLKIISLINVFHINLFVCFSCARADGCCHCQRLDHLHPMDTPDAARTAKQTMIWSHIKVWLVISMVSTLGLLESEQFRESDSKGQILNDRRYVRYVSEPNVNSPENESEIWDNSNLDTPSPIPSKARPRQQVCGPVDINYDDTARRGAYSRRVPRSHPIWP